MVLDKPKPITKKLINLCIINARFSKIVQDYENHLILEYLCRILYSTEFAVLSIRSHMINRYIMYSGRNNLSKVFDETCFNEMGIRQNGTSTKSFFKEMVQ